MKNLFLTLLTMALMAISVKAQEVCSFNPGNVLGLDMEKETALAAGTVIGETANIVATIGADDIYKPQSVKATVTGGEINGGLQGSSNPKDADSGLPATTLIAPVSGAYLEFKAKADGFLYLIIYTLSNKTYTVFEEGTAIGYTFAAIGDASTDLGAVYQFTLVGEGELNEIKYPIERAEQEFLKATDPEKYAAHQTTNEDGTVSWTAIKVNGLGVIKFPVYKDCKYIVCGSGNKILAAGYVFSKEDNVTISSDGVTIIGEGGTENTVELYFNYIEKGKVAEVIEKPNGQKYEGTVIIPSTVIHEGEEYIVNKIADNAFRGCEDMTSITIPNSVKSIGQFAFSECFSLKSLIIPEGVESIGFEAFSDCSGIVNLTLPQSLKTIDYAAFARLSIETVVIPNGISILNGTFYGCVNLTSVIVPYNVKGLDAAFYGCKKLTNITLQEGVNTIGHATFLGCSSLKEIIIPNSVKNIAAESFLNCSSLSSLIIPNSVTSIDYDAFKGCSGLTSVTIGKGVKSINNNVFSKCDKLTDVYCMPEQISKNSLGGDGLYTASNAFDESYPEYIILHVPAASIEAYSSTKPWSQFKAIVALEDGDNPEIKKCATPEISYANGKVSLSCETEDVEFISKVIVEDAKDYYDSEFTLSQTYKITVYATKAGYENSDVVTREIVIENGQSSLFGDLDKDGKVNVADHVKLSDIIMNK